MLVEAIISLLVFWILMGLMDRWFDLKKRGFKIYPFLLIWRTERGIRFIERTGKAHKRGWRTFGTLSAAIGCILMVLVFLGLATYAALVLARPVIKTPGATLVLPGVVPGLTLLAWLVAVASLLLVHELAHGFVLSAQGLRVNSVGPMVFVAFPGAFVEPDEKQLKEAPVSSRLRVYGAGSTANVIFAFLCLCVFLAMLVPKPGVYVYGVQKGYPGENLELGTRIYSIDNRHLTCLEDFHNFMESTSPGQVVHISTDKGDFQIELAKKPDNENRGFLGIGSISAFPRSLFINPSLWAPMIVAELSGVQVFHPYVFDTLAPREVVDVIKWMFILNLGVGLFNLLPLLPLDGGYIFQGIVEKVSTKRRAEILAKGFTIIVLVLLIINFMPLLR